jgi:hypothetical protein
MLLLQNILCVSAFHFLVCQDKLFIVHSHTEEELWAEQFYVNHSVLLLPKQWFLLIDFCSVYCSTKGAGLHKILLFCSLFGLLVSPGNYRDCKTFCPNLCTAWLLWGCQSADELFQFFTLLLVFINELFKVTASLNNYGNHLQSLWFQI